MAEPDATELALWSALHALDAIRDRIVVVGGTAHRLFPKHELAAALDFEPLSTEDVDLGVELGLSPGCPGDLLGPLEAAGFEKEVVGAEDLPSCRYRLRASKAAPSSRPYLQFLAHRRGGSLTRTGKRNASFLFGGLPDRESCESRGFPGSESAHRREASARICRGAAVIAKDHRFDAPDSTTISAACRSALPRALASLDLPWTAR